MTWDCPHCGCQAIAPDLTFCPQCFKERDMPKSTVEGGGSNVDGPTAQEPDEVLVPTDEAVAPPEPEPGEVVIKPEQTAGKGSKDSDAQDN